MSSTYRVLCLSHDPAILVADFNHLEDALTAVETNTEGHPECDILMARISGAPVEFACFGEPRSLRSNRVCYCHKNLEWVDADWLRLLSHVQGDQTEEIRKLRSRPTMSCWTPERVHRLRYELGVG